MAGLRRRPGQSPQVTHVELDLVYVFAVTQLPHPLRGPLPVRDAPETLVLFFDIWEAWNYTAWATNWIDPDHGSRVRALGRSGRVSDLGSQPNVQSTVTLSRAFLRTASS